MRSILFASVASVGIAAFMSEVTETVLVHGQDGKPLRINKSNFDADQAEDGDGLYEEYTGDDATNPETQSLAGTPIRLPDDAPAIAAPSAPDFSGTQGETTNRVDPLKNAVAPSAPSSNQRLVTKIGKKFYVVDGTGEKIKMDGIDIGGYDTEQAAWKAVTELPH